MRYTVFEVKKMKLIQRDYYLNALLAVKDIPDIKVITGVD